MENIYLKKDDISDIDKLDDYNNDYLNYYKDFKPFITKDNYEDILKDNKLKEQGINNNGIKEIYYWAIEDNKIVGHASIRLNPEIDEGILKYCGHIMYGVIPSKRNKGYGSKICHLLIEKLNELNYRDIIVTCSDDNIASEKVIISNYGKLIEVVDPDMINTTKRTKRYIINIEDSLKEYKL